MRCAYNVTRSNRNVSALCGAGNRGRCSRTKHTARGTIRKRETAQQRKVALCAPAARARWRVRKRAQQNARGERGMPMSDALKKMRAARNMSAAFNVMLQTQRAR